MYARFWSLAPRFRGSIAPASLKRSRAPARADRARGFPGLYCPGLIEALAVAPAPAIRRAGFRGSIAPASLKPRRRGAGRSICPRFRGSIAPASLKRAAEPRTGNAAMKQFPGLYCPGLIEADSDALGSHGGQPGFRGSIAPASLKPGDLAARVAVPAGFRGSIAPASLKPARRPFFCVHGSLFPGLYCPGLIEACWGWAASPPTPEGVSGALLPRPH